MILKITGGRIVTSSGYIDGKDIYCENGVITAITNEECRFDKQIDAGGNFISPGFIDLHVHGAVDYDFSADNEQSAINAVNYHLKHGTTTIYPTITSVPLNTMDSALGVIENIIKDQKTPANVMGAHLEGPYFSPKQAGAQDPAIITPPKAEDYNYLLGKYPSVIKRWSFAPELEGTEQFMDALNNASVVASVAHTDALYSDVEKVHNKGCKLITHFYSCTSTITRDKGFRRLGVIEAGYLMDDMAVEVIADGCHIPKELFSLIHKIKGDDNICLVTDAIQLAGSDNEFATVGGVPCKVKDGVARLLDESAFAGSIATTNRLVRFCVNDVKLPLYTAIKMITKNPAKVMGLKNKGEIAVGYDADIVIFDNDINIKNIIVNGKEVSI